MSEYGKLVQVIRNDNLAVERDGYMTDDLPIQWVRSQGVHLETQIRHGVFKMLVDGKPVRFLN